MDLGLNGRVAVVTAASKGLGRASAQALAAEGTKIVLNARNAAALEELATTMPDAIVVAGDITDPDVPARLVEAAVARWGRIDIVDDGITVNIAAPGLHATNRLIERGVTGRTGDPADFGKVIAFLCSEPANFINGTAIGIDGGSVTGLL